MFHRYLLGLILAAITTGICADRLGELSVRFWNAVLWLSLLSSLLSVIPVVQSRKRQKLTGTITGHGKSQSECFQIASFQVFGMIPIAATFVCWSSLAGALHHASWFQVPENHVVRFARVETNPVILRGYVSSTPRTFSAQDRFDEGEVEKCSFELQVTQIRLKQRWQNVSGICLVVATCPETKLKRGDRVELYGDWGQISSPRNFGAPDFAAFYRQRRILVRCFVEENGLLPLEKRSRSEDQSAPKFQEGHRLRPLLQTVNEFRFEICVHFEKIIEANLSKASQPFAKAVLLGDSAELTTANKQQYMQTGTIHMLAISGLHIGFIVAPFYLFGRLSTWNRWLPLAVGIFAAFFFAWLTGFRAPVVRAAILIAIMWTARVVGRRAGSWQALALAAILVLLVDPPSLFSPGAQLSFLAVATLIHIRRVLPAPINDDRVDEVHREARRIFAPWWISTTDSILNSVKELARTSLFLWLSACPLVAHQFHVISPIAIPINVAAIPLIGILMFSGLAMILFGTLGIPASQIAGWVFDLTYHLLHLLIELGSATPLGSSRVEGPPAWWVVGFYLILFAAAFLKQHVKPIGGVWKLLLVWCCLNSLESLPEFASRLGWVNRQSIKCVFVDVGHGTAVVIQLPDGKTLLYDAGSLSGGSVAFERIESTLWYLGVKHLDAIVLTHADSDHFNAIVEMMDRRTIGCVYVEPSMLRHRSELWREAKAKLDANHIRLSPIVSGDSYTASRDCSIQVLHPPKNLHGENDNERSVSLKLRHFNHSLLLTGDLEEQGLKRIQNNTLQTTVLMAPHHGSPLTPIRELVQHSMPELVVISGSRNAKSDTTISRYESSGAIVMTTFEDGAICLRIGRDDVQAQTRYTGRYFKR